MPTYLVRRRDKFGRFVHVDTVRDPPTEINQEYLRQSFGIGVYNVVIAVEGQQGLKRYGDFVVAPPIDFKGYYAVRPTINQIRDEYGSGSYLIAKMSSAFPYQILRGTEVSSTEIDTFDKLESYAPALRGWGVFKLRESIFG